MKKLALAVCTLFVFMLSAHSMAVAGQGNPGIAKITSSTAIPKSYADLGAEWWQWALQAPLADSPFNDVMGENCRVGQQGPVWFLAGTLGSGDPTVQTYRYCEVPAGKAIFFPMINAAWLGFLNDPEEQRTAEFARWAADVSCDRNSIEGLSVTIDGMAVNNPIQFATTGEQSPIFQVQLPTDNILEATNDWLPQLMLSPSAHQGFYIYIKPLAVGEHTIEWTATWDCGTENVKYDLNVLEGVAGEVQ